MPSQGHMQPLGRSPLLPQPDGFEGLLPLVEQPKARDLLVLDGVIAAALSSQPATASDAVR